MKKLKVAILASYPAQSILSTCEVKPRYRKRIIHPASWVRSLTTALVKHDNIKCRVFTHSRAVANVIKGEENGVDFIFIPKYEPAKLGAYHGHLPARIQFRQQLNRFHPDLIHGLGTESSYGYIAAKQQTPNIVSIQGILGKLLIFSDRFSALQKAILLRLERTTIKTASVLIAETPFAKKWAISVNPSAKVHIIPHAVNTEFFGVTPMFSSNECLCIGALHKIKAVDVAIRALAATADKDLKLSVIGTGPLQKEMRILAGDLGVSNRVDFCGYLTREQIMEKMQHARMLAILSRMDTSPNVLTEANAAGLPVIGTKTGGIPDMINSGKNGFLVDVDDFRAVAKCMSTLSSNTELCQQMGENGRKLVYSINTPDRIASMHIQLYHHLVTEHKSKYNSRGRKM